MSERKSEEPVFMQHRLKLSAPGAIHLPENSYSGPYAVESLLASPPPNTWMKKKTRALRVFYFFSHDASESYRLQQKKRRLCEINGDTAAAAVPSHVYIPLEPGYMLWFAIPVPPGYTSIEAVDEVIWSPISREAAEVLRWFTSFVNDPEIPKKLSLHEKTLAFLDDFKECCDNGAPMGVLQKYIPTLTNDGSVHKQRRPLTAFPCVV
jgi:hypothetical protein